MAFFPVPDIRKSIQFLGFNLTEKNLIKNKDLNQMPLAKKAGAN
tara:strand:- start:197 stop:328 length:132 start_codon:yes stop_codon:yes gene_type:complete